MANWKVFIDDIDVTDLIDLPLLPLHAVMLPCPYCGEELYDSVWRDDKGVSRCSTCDGDVRWNIRNRIRWWWRDRRG